MPSPFSRRGFLQGVSLGSATTLLSSVLRQLEARAAGIEKLPQRVVIVMEGNGLPTNQIQPPDIAREKKRDYLSEHDLTDLPLPPAFEPLEPFKDRLTIVQGLSSRIVGSATHSADFGALGAYPRRGVRGETLNV